MRTVAGWLWAGAFATLPAFWAVVGLLVLLGQPGGSPWWLASLAPVGLAPVLAGSALAAEARRMSGTVPDENPCAEMADAAWEDPLSSGPGGGRWASAEPVPSTALRVRADTHPQRQEATDAG